MTTDITELAQREKFEAWFEGAEALPWGYLKNRRTSDSAYQDQDITDMWVAWKAAGDELVEALEKAQAKNALVAGGIDASTKLHEQLASLKSENAALKGSVENAAGCINAAYAEGLIDVLAESSDERLVDLVKRRLLHAYLPVETPATNDVLVAMGDAVLLEQLEDSRKAIVSQSEIIDLQDKHNVALESHKAALLKFISDSCYVFDGYDADISDAYVDAITSGLMPELESRTVTVKLPSLNPEMFNGDVMFGYRKAQKEAVEFCAAAGIKVEVE